jgi:major membrane immunogen (membrane-anchored lipoprotein)
MKASLSLNDHLEKSLIRGREKDEDDGRWKNFVTIDDGKK